MKREKTQTELLQEFCTVHVGEHYTSIMLDNAPVDWQAHWPIIDADGNLTGDVYESEQPDGNDYANVDDLAMIHMNNLSAAERRRIHRAQQDQTWDGYAKL